MKGLLIKEALDVRYSKYKYKKEILLPKEALVSAIKRAEEVIIPDGNTLLKAGDQVIVIGKKDDVEKVVKRFGAN